MRQIIAFKIIQKIPTASFMSDNAINVNTWYFSSYYKLFSQY